MCGFYCTTFRLQKYGMLWPLCLKLLKRWDHWNTKKRREDWTIPQLRHPTSLWNTESSRKMLATLHFLQKLGKRNTSQSWHQDTRDKVFTPFSEIRGRGSLLKSLKLSWKQKSMSHQLNADARLGTWLVSCTGCLERCCKLCLTCIPQHSTTSWSLRVPCTVLHESDRIQNVFISQFCLFFKYTASAKTPKEHLWTSFEFFVFETRPPVLILHPPPSKCQRCRCEPPCFLWTVLKGEEFKYSLVLLWDVSLYAVNVCGSHWIINKAVLAYDKKVYSEAGNPSRDTERRESEERPAHLPATDRASRLVTHGHVAMYRFIEMG